MGLGWVVRVLRVAYRAVSGQATRLSSEGVGPIQKGIHILKAQFFPVTFLILPLLWREWVVQPPLNVAVKRLALAACFCEPKKKGLHFLIALNEH